MTKNISRIVPQLILGNFYLKPSNFGGRHPQKKYLSNKKNYLTNPLKCGREN